MSNLHSASHLTGTRYYGKLDHDPGQSRVTVEVALTAAYRLDIKKNGAADPDGSIHRRLMQVAHSLKPFTWTSMDFPKFKEQKFSTTLSILEQIKEVSAEELFPH